MTVYTTPVYRDPSAWYHLVVAVDTTNSTSANTVRIYINGVQQSVAGSYPATNLDTWVNGAYSHRIGARWSGPSSSSNFDGYMAEVNFVDGYPAGYTQATFATNNISALFGETDQQTGVWIPKRYTGTYGTNGFRLSFANNSSTTALGYDSSGTGNNWTTNNFSVTPGVGNDSLLDVPSLYNTDTGLGGEVIGNYATLNPLEITTLTKPTNGNLDYSPSNTAPQVAISTITIPSTGKWYAEFTKGSSTSSFSIGAIGALRTAQYVGHTDSIGYFDAGQIYKDGTLIQSSLATYASGDVVGVAIDVAAQTIQFYKNGVVVGTAVSYTYSQISFACGNYVSGQVYNANFGQRPFAYTAPSGFKALCTTNLPAPAIGQTSNNQADNHFNVVTYSGNGSTQNLTTDFAPDLVWIKNRTTNYSHMLYDTLRGASTGSVSKVISSNATDSEGIVNDNSTYGYLSSFNANGFTVTAGSFTGSGGYTNTSGQNYVAWCWNAGGVSVTNSAGTNGATIASIYRANRAAGFSIVTYTGNGVDGATVAHGLGTAPAFIIVKSRSNAFNWGVWHKNLAKYDANHAYAIGLNITRPADATAQYAVFYPGVNTVNVFGLGNEGTANQSNSTYVAYCFAEVPGFSAFGSYTGNGSSDGPFIYLGFRPAFLLFKNISQTYGWQIFDYKRNPNNRVNLGLYPNVSNAEGTEAGTGPIDFLSNGFKIRDAIWEEINGSTRTYIYAAFAETPARLSTAR
jgi:hypothetical protein